MTRPQSPYPGVASHVPILWELLQTVQPTQLYEFGAGMYSTPLLAKWAETRDVILTTGENNSDWKPRPSNGMHVVYGTDVTLSQAILYSTPNSIAFVDCEADLRVPIVTELLDRSRIGWVVVHDCEAIAERAYPGMRKQLKRWANGYNAYCPFTGIGTGVVSRVVGQEWFAVKWRIDALSRREAGHMVGWDMAQRFILTGES